MNYYTSISVCPKTKEPMSRDDVMSMGGVCPRCGDSRNSTVSHEEKVVGTWVYPSNYRWWMYWVRPVWLKKDA